jgi:hypothetical protein
MTHHEPGTELEGESVDSGSSAAIDPKKFFQYASSGEGRWQELIGLTINHCTFGLGTISKVEGDYITVDLPERHGKKHLTEFGLESFLRGYFSNLLGNATLQQKMVAAAEAREAMILAALTAEAEKPKPAPKKKKKVTKATKKAD